MTSGLGVEHVEQQLTFHCSCGAAIETSEKKETCWNCGETVELRRCIPTANGNKYVLRISKPRPSIETQQFVWPRSFSAGTTMQGAQPTLHSFGLPDSAVPALGADAGGLVCWHIWAASSASSTARSAASLRATRHHRDRLEGWASHVSVVEARG
jgi:predicted RNA-binding Zn-ribbon protein involved in translation (DUF1610 family)